MSDDPHSDSSSHEHETVVSSPQRGNGAHSSARTRFTIDSTAYIDADTELAKLFAKIIHHDVRLPLKRPAMQRYIQELVECVSDLGFLLLGNHEATFVQSLVNDYEEMLKLIESSFPSRDPKVRKYVPSLGEAFVAGARDVLASMHVQLNAIKRETSLASDEQKARWPYENYGQPYTLEYQASVSLNLDSEGTQRGSFNPDPGGTLGKSLERLKEMAHPSFHPKAIRQEKNGQPFGGGAVLLPHDTEVQPVRLRVVR